MVFARQICTWHEYEGSHNHTALEGVNENEGFAFQAGPVIKLNLFYFYQDKSEKPDYNTGR